MASLLGVKLPLVIKEKGGRNRVVVLNDSDLPRNQGWMTLGGKSRAKVTWYPGSPEPTTQILGPEEGEIDFSGEFDDHQKGITGHATAMATLLDRVRQVGHLVTIEYGPFIRTCRWVEFTYKVRDITRITYRARFEIVRVGLANRVRVVNRIKKIPGLGKVLTAAGDIVATVAGLPAGLGGEKVAKVTTTVQEVLSAVTSAGEILDSIPGGDVVDPKKAKQALNFVDSGSDSARAAYAQLSGLDWTSIAGSKLQAVAGGGLSAIQARRDVLGIARDLRSARPDVAKLAEEAEGNALYITATGDTLQRIARRFYGSAAKWTDILAVNGLDGATLTPGTRLLIPNAPAFLGAA